MTEPGDHLPEPEALAAEYVLGTLPLTDRIAAEALIARDPAFRALVEDWRDRLAPLNEGYAPEDPPPELFGRIETRLFPRARRGAGWLLGALAGLAAAALAAMALVAVLPSPPAPLTAELRAENQPLVMEARFDPSAGALTVTRTAGPAAEAGRDYELWMIPEGGAPVSMGVVREAALTVPLSALPAGSTLAITLEAAGGSPTGAPQGALLVAAVITGG